MSAVPAAGPRPNLHAIDVLPAGGGRPSRASTSRSAHLRSVYGRPARGYDRYHRRVWLSLLAARRRMRCSRRSSQWSALVPRVLDAGAGTGALSRRPQAGLPALHPILVDLSPAMLARSVDLEDPRAVVTLNALPFTDDTFDVIICGWFIETVDRPEAVVAELLRVLRAGGTLTYSF